MCGNSNVDNMVYKSYNLWILEKQYKYTILTPTYQQHVDNFIQYLFKTNI